jgi:hypothetical protein
MNNRIRLKVYAFNLLGLVILGSLILSFAGCAERKAESIISQEIKLEDSKRKKSEEMVKEFLNRWEKSQDEKNILEYENCYSSDFVGIKRVGNKTLKLKYADWLIDRRKMMNKADDLDIEVKNLKITIDEDRATIQFIQYYRSRQYADFGSKTISLKRENGEYKIDFEELGYSTKIHD